MNKKLTALGLVAVAAWLTTPGLPATAEAQDGPIRQGLRNTAQGAAQAAGRAGQATRNVAEGAARGTAEAVRRTGEAARNVAEGTGEAVRRVAPPYQGQYRSGYRGNAYSNGGYVDGNVPANYQGQPYSQNRWNSGGYATGAVHQLRYDACGREWICVNGQRVYLTNSTTSNQSQQADSRQQQTPDMAPPAAPTDPQSDQANQQSNNEQDAPQQSNNSDGVQTRFNAQAAEAAAEAELRATQGGQGAVIDGGANVQQGDSAGLDTPAPPANADAQATGPEDAGFDIDASPNE